MTKQKEQTKFNGMGAVPLESGVGFRVWAPFADTVFVTGDFNRWDKSADSLQHEENGYWSAVVSAASVDDEYKFIINNGDTSLSRIDPYARAVTNSVGNGIIVSDNFKWGNGDYVAPSQNKTIIYELHVGSFNAKDKEALNPFDSVIRKLDYLQDLGITHIELLPLAEFAGDTSWGYNPANLFAIEESYGGAEWFKTLVKSAHARGIGVILDVVYNHFGPSDLDLWRFDGWSENDGGGIYFYNDWRGRTPWGDTRPDYGREEVRSYIHDNALFWFDEYRVDGLRLDATNYIRSVDSDGNPDSELSDGWRLMQSINKAVHERHPTVLMIAEDLQKEAALTESAESGGAGFDSQWDAAFVHPVREALLASSDADRNLFTIANALTHKYGDDAFHRIIFTESHDEVANGQARIVEEIGSDERTKAFAFAKRRSILGAALTLTTPGIPMLFMGQEFLEDDWFEDTRPLDWKRAKKFSGIVDLYRDLIALRRNVEGHTRGLTGYGVQITHLNNDEKVLVYQRWMDGGAGDMTVIALNFADQIWPEYTIGVPTEGTWQVRFNSDSPRYDDSFDGVSAEYYAAEETPYDGQPFSITLSVGAYAAMLLSQD